MSKEKRSPTASSTWFLTFVSSSGKVKTGKICCQGTCVTGYANEASIRGMIAEVSDLIDRAGLGITAWQEVSRQIAEFLPDAFCWINSQNIKTGALNFAAISGLSADSIAAYESYFCKINPFNPVWDRFKTGEIITSEATIPLATFRKTEFYNEFLAKSGDFQMGVGVKIDATDMDRFVMPIHFPLSMTSTYEPVVRRLFRSIEGNLKRASELNRQYSDLLVRSVSAAALTGRSRDLAFVVDANLKIADANDKAEQAFRASTIIGNRGGRIAIGHAQTEVWLQKCVSAFAFGLPVSDNKHVCKTADHLWLFSVYRVPEHDPRSSGKFFGTQHLAMVTVRDLYEAPETAIDQTVASHFNLSSAERQLCTLLLSGRTLRECADQLELSIETIRTRIKSIFFKTGTSRQSELISLLMRS